MSENGHPNGASHLDWLRARHDALKADRSLDLDVPGYDGRVVIRYGPAPWRVVSKFQTTVATTMAERDGSDAMLQAQCDLLIAACREVLFRAGDELEPIDPSGEPSRIGPELATLLGAENITTARGALLWLFPSELAVSLQAGEVLSWTRSAVGEDAESLVGE